MQLFEKAVALSKDPARASECAAMYEAAAAEGLPEAQLNLGAILEAGDRALAQDLPRAAKLYAAAAEHGISAAQYNLGMRAMGIAELSGEAGRVDASQAAAWFRKAAERGDAYSWFALAHLLWRGRGVPRNRAESLRLAGRAARSEGGWREIVGSFPGWARRLLTRLRLE